MRFGCCAPMERYEEIARAGYDYIELPAWQVAEVEDITPLREKIKQVGLPCLRLNSYCKGTPAIVGPTFDPEAVERYAKRLMERAEALGVECVGVGAPAARRLPEGYDRALADRQCEEFTRITAREAQRRGIWLLLEAVQKGFCNYLNETPQALEMVERLALPNVALVVDLYHMETMGESWDTLPRYLGMTHHVHVSTVGEGLARGLYGAEDEETCRAAFAALTKAGYDGTVSIEPDAVAITPQAVTLALELMKKAARS